MMKSKSMKSSAPAYAKGGSGKMVGKQSAKKQAPGQTASMGTSSGGKFPMGGSGKMAGKQSAKPAKPA